MAQYSLANIKFVGSHPGTSIGPDGFSQMGLEDISMFLSMPDAVILYPSDAVSAGQLVRTMALHAGISYLRTTREKKPVIYENGETFPVGGLKVLRQDERDRVLVVAAGITVHEALKAHEILKKENILIRVIDLYSLQPFDGASLVRDARECHANVITVEDHYCNALGGIVASVVRDVSCLCVREIPRSGKPEELLRRYGIDAATIVTIYQGGNAFCWSGPGPGCKSHMSENGHVPSHIAIIMDGNGRWARRRGLVRILGHREGVASVREITRECAKKHVQQLTLYAFSQENWKRPKREVNVLMKLLKDFLIKERGEIEENNIRLTAIGRIDGLPEDVQRELAISIDESKNNTGWCFVLRSITEGVLRLWMRPKILPGI